MQWLGNSSVEEPRQSECFRPKNAYLTVARIDNTTWNRCGTTFAVVGALRLFMTHVFALNLNTAHTMGMRDRAART